MCRLFNLRGWKSIDDLIAAGPGGEGSQCRLLVGMQRLPQDELPIGLGTGKEEQALDNQTALRLKRKLAEEFRLQLTLGMPNNADEAGLRRLTGQLKSKQVTVRLFLKHPLHAKLYLLFRPDPNNPRVRHGRRRADTRTLGQRPKAVRAPGAASETAPPQLRTAIAARREVATRPIRRKLNFGWGARIRTWEWRNQNPLPYRLATPQQDAAGT